jgi:hypothetical protein
MLEPAPPPPAAAAPVNSAIDESSCELFDGDVHGLYDLRSELVGLLWLLWTRRVRIIRWRPPGLLLLMLLLLLLLTPLLPLVSCR